MVWIVVLRGLDMVLSLRSDGADLSASHSFCKKVQLQTLWIPHIHHSKQQTANWEVFNTGAPAHSITYEVG